MLTNVLAVIVKTAKEPISLPTETNMSVNGKTINAMESVLSLLLMANGRGVNIMAAGKITRWKAKALSIILTAAYMKENLRTIKLMASAHILIMLVPGRAENIRENGKTI